MLRIFLIVILTYIIKSRKNVIKRVVKPTIIDDFIYSKLIYHLELLPRQDYIQESKSSVQNKRQ